MNDTKKLLEVRDLHKAYSKEGVPTKALNGITFDVLNGEYLGIMGASGSGKTTLLNCIALLRSLNQPLDKFYFQVPI